MRLVFAAEIDPHQGQVTRVRSGVNGTPAFFINQRRHQGSFDYEELVAAIEMAQEQESEQAAALAGG